MPNSGNIATLSGNLLTDSGIDLSTKADLVGGLIPSSQLPSYVDDVLEFANLAGFPATGETGKIYVALDTNETYRWSGSAFIRIANGAVQSVNSLTGNVTLTTANIAESGNLYYTDARVRAAISASGSLSYNASTGVFSYTTPNSDGISEGSTNLYFTNARARAAISVSGSLSYNATTGVISYTQPTNVSAFTNDAAYITIAGARNAISVAGSLSYNATTGVISYTQPTTVSTFTNDAGYITLAQARAGISVAGSLSYNSTTGVISYTQPTNVSAFTNDSGYITTAGARSAISVAGSLSYNSSTGVISYTQPANISAFSNDSGYVTAAGARAALSFAAGSGAYNSSTGVITIPTNTNQLTNGAGFITSYTETDTLQSVTTRGNSTTRTLTSTNSLGLYVNSGGASYIGINSTSSWAYTSLLNNGSTTWDLGAFNGGNFEFRPYGGDSNRIIVGLNGVMYFTDTTNGIYKSGGRFTVRSESTDNVANFADYGLYLPRTGQVAGLYVESPIEARGGLRMGNGAGNGTITVGADTAASANRLVQRDGGGDIYSRYSFAVHFNASSPNNENPSIAAIWTNSAADNYLRKSTPAHLISQLGLVTGGPYLPLSGGTMTGAIVNNTDGAIIMESNASENNNWLWKEAVKQWGIFYFNRGSQSGQTIGGYSTIGAETFFMGGSSGIDMPSGWTGFQSGSRIAAMISHFNGYIYSASTIFAASDMRAPIFYDSQNTGFYLDPNGTSNLNQLIVSGDGSDRARLYVRSSANTANDIWFGAANINHWSLTSRDTSNPFFALFNAGIGDWAYTVNYTTNIVNFNYGATISSNTIWHAGNDGAGSGLDADLLDGVQLDNVVWGNARGTNDSVTTDNNALDKTGYYTSSAFTNRPSGVANWMYIEHIKLYNANALYQKQIGYDTYDDRMWVRTENAGTWTSWKQIWTSESLTNLNQLSNGPGYITGINGTMVTNALGYTPFNAGSWGGNLFYELSWTSTSTGTRYRVGRVYYNACHWGSYGVMKIKVRNTYYNGGYIEWTISNGPGEASIKTTDHSLRQTGQFNCFLGSPVQQGSHAGCNTFYREIFIELNAYIGVNVDFTWNAQTNIDSNDGGNSQYANFVIYTGGNRTVTNQGITSPLVEYRAPRVTADTLAVNTTDPAVNGLVADFNGAVGIRTSNRLYFGHSNNNFNSWSTAIYASGSTMLYNAQTHIFNNEGYGSTFSTTINASGISSSNIVLNSTDTTTPINIIGATHKYLTINPGNGWEAMVRYIGGAGSSWFVGKRTSGQTVTTSDFHFFSEAAGTTVVGIDTGGNIFAKGGLYFERGDGSFTSFVRAQNYTDQGFSGPNNRYWVELGSWGGVHVTLNMDGGANAGENSFDHFTIWQFAANSSSGSRQFYVTNIGNVWARNDITAFSDARVKENIRPIENALEKVVKSRGVLYDRIDTGEKNGIGFIAQELEVQLPDLVKTDDKGLKSVKYQNMVAVLTEAIKEQQTQIEAQKTEIEELKDLVKQLINK